METCDFCKKQLPKYGKGAHKLFCNRCRLFMERYSLSREDIEREYAQLGSVLSFRDKYPIGKHFSFYYALFSRLNIPVSLKFSKNHKKTREKTEKTYKERYGVNHNFCKGSPSRLEWERRLLEQEGITNVFQREEVKEKALSSLIKKYGEESYSNRTYSRGRCSFTAINKQVCDILLKNNIPFQVEKKIKREGKKGSYFAYDIILRDTVKLIEVNGDYWHGNPILYKANDIIMKNSSSEMLVKDKWAYDQQKITHAQAVGYEVKVVWEYDLKTKPSQVEQEIIDYARSTD